MAIRFKCDSCGKSWKADESKAGKRFRCPACENVTTIPELEPAEERYHDFNSLDDDEFDDDNVYAPPQSDRSSRSHKKRPPAGSLEPASPGKRFLGAVLDNMITTLFVIPAIVCFALSGAFDPSHKDEAVTMLLAGFFLLLAGLTLCLGLYVYLYATRSQSIAKYLLNMQVLDYETDEPAGFVKAFVLRSVVNGMIGAAVPMYQLVDALFIFGEEHRCLHDKIAGTYVVDIS